MKREYNVRIIVKKDGSLELGFVYGLYKTGSKEFGRCVMEWKSVPESIREKLALKLGCKF